MKLFSRSLLIVLLTVVVLSMGQGFALAHANLERSDPPANAILPAAPPWVQLWFTEAVESRSSQITVYDSQRRRIDKGIVQVASPDGRSIKSDIETVDRGSYTVVWQVMSAVDGHVTKGFFVFSVGEESPVQAAPSAGAPPSVLEPPSILAVFVRWGSLIASSVLFAGFVLGALLGRRPREQTSGRAREGVSWFRKQLRGSMSFAVALAALMAPATLLLQSSSAGLADVSALGAFVVDTRFGLVWLSRLGLILGIAATVYLLREQGRVWAPWAGIALGALLLLTSSLNSHGAALADAGPLPLVTDWVHSMAAAVWTGGLVHVARALVSQAAAGRRRSGSLRRTSRDRGRSAKEDGGVSLASILLPAFSNLAFLSVSVLVLTGLYSTWLQIGSLERLFSTPYGLTLLAKLALGLLALSLGAVSSIRLRQLISGSASWTAGAFRKSMLIEAVLGMAVLAAVALLVLLPPGRDSGPEGRSGALVQSQRSGAAVIILEIDPGTVGRNNFRIYVVDSKGRPLSEPARMVVSFNYLDGDVGVESASAPAAGPGLFEGQWTYLGLAGKWQVETVFRRDGLDDLTASFPVSVELPQAPQEEAVGLVGGPVPANLLLGIEALALSAIVFAGSWLKRRSLETAMERLAGRVLGMVGRAPGRPLGGYAVTGPLVLGSVFALAGAYLLVGEVVGDFSPSKWPRNPIPATAQSRETGKEIYGKHCLECHGPEGFGDGPRAREFTSDLDLSSHVLIHPSGELFVWITYGLGDDMPFFEEILTEDERWHLVNYIRTLGQSSLFGAHAH